MKTNFTAVACALWLLAAWASPAESSNLHVRLKEFLELPRSQLTIGFVIDSESGLRSMAEKLAVDADARTWPAALPRVEKDAKRLLQIGSALAGMERTNEARQVRERALRIYEQHWKAESNSVSARLHVASALGALARNDEEERLLAEGLERAPKEWRYHAAIAEFYHSQAARVAFFDPESPPAKPLPLEEVNKFEQYRQRAREKWTNTWTLADDAPNAHFQFANFLAKERWMPARLSFRQNRRWEQSVMFEAHTGAFFTPEVLGHLRQSARDTKNPLAVTAVGYFGSFAAAATGEKLSVQSLMEKAAKGEPPREVRQVALETVQRLGSLANELPPEDAAMTLEYKGMFEMMFLRDEAAMLSSAKRAVELSPRRDSARQLLLSCYVGEDAWTNALEVVNERLRMEDSAEWRFYAARALDRLDRAAEAEQQIRKALAVEPSYAPAKVSLAAFSVRHATNLTGIVRAKIALEEANKALTAGRDTLERDAWVLQWLSLQTYFVALELLAEHTDHAEKALQDLLSYKPDHEPGQKLEKLMKELLRPGRAEN